MRYFLKLAFNGSKFHGWQSQPNAVSVQSEIEKALSILLRKEISVTGAGRTDSGVHARTMYAHFDSEDKPVNLKKFLSSLNKLVGPEITVENLIPVSDEAHARFDAIERTYKYFVSFNKNPFIGDFSWHTGFSLNLDEMNQAAQILLTTRDFTSFAKLHSDAKTNICEVRKSFWSPIKDDKEAEEFIGIMDDGLVFTISADRFLRNMVRAIVGTLVEVGKGKLSVGEFVKIIERKDRCAAGVSMPAQGLFLWDISYPYL